jgi:alanyl-tRNA synthetase
MRYRRRSDGSLCPLEQSSVDTGMGLERMVSVLQGRRSVYHTDVFAPWRSTVPRLWPDLDLRSQRLVLDHLRSSVVVLGDGVRPSNTGRGYVLRRLIRRTLTTLWRDDPSRSLGDLPSGPVEHTLHHFRLPLDAVGVGRALREEENRFRALLDRGRDVVSRHRGRSGGPLREDDFRYLHDTHGLPRELVVGLLSDGGWSDR